MLICKKCGKSFPFHITIDGKDRNLKNRKYCLECSPFGQHNTRKIELTKEETDESRRRQRIQAVNRRREKIKRMAVEYKGGKCCVCEYNKYYGALEFHHLNPEEKEFKISSGNCKSWEKIKKELDKCILVCSNCHKEIEGGIIDLNINT